MRQRGRTPRFVGQRADVPIQGRVKDILEENAALPMDEVSTLVEKWQQRFAGRRFRDSANIIREDRRR